MRGLALCSSRAIGMLDFFMSQCLTAEEVDDQSHTVAWWIPSFGRCAKQGCGLRNASERCYIAIVNTRGLTKRSILKKNTIRSLI